MKFKFLRIYFLVFLLSNSLLLNFLEAKEISLDDARSVQQETQLVFGRILIGDFKILNGPTKIQNVDREFCKYLLQEFNSKSYWDSECGMNVKESKNINGSDAALTGEWKDRELTVTLRSKNLRYVLGSWKTEISPPEGVLLKPAAEQVAAFLISQIPMIGHVTKVAGNGKVMINLGSRKGLRVGQTFKIFDYLAIDHPLNGKQSDVARLEIQTILGPDSAVANVSYFTREEPIISTGAKVKIDDSTIIKSSLAEREGERTWMSLGGQLMNIRVSTDPFSVVQKRNYNFNYTPFLDLAIGTKKMYAHALYGQATGPSADISYLEVEAGSDIYRSEFEDGYLLFAAGLNISQFSASNHVTPGLYEDSQRISPFLDVRIQYEPRPRFVFYIGSKILYPTFTTSQIGGAELFSYGVEPYIGTRIQISSKFAAEIMARTRYFSLNYSGNTGVRETQTAFLLRGIYLFN